MRHVEAPSELHSDFSALVWMFEGLGRSTRCPNLFIPGPAAPGSCLYLAADVLVGPCQRCFVGPLCWGCLGHAGVPWSCWELVPEAPVLTCSSHFVSMFVLRHWYYGGPDQIRTDFGHLLTDYERSVHPFPDSIMQLSNTGGGGRGSDEGDVVGGVILHDKKPYWRRGGQFHYHHTLEAGENTLEAVLAREMIRSLTSTGGRFSAEDFRRRYIALMTTPGTHNDTYASTCHRMFFKKWRSGVAPENCPDNDGHNVDTMDGLVLPSVVALVALARGESLEEAAKQGSEALAVTRASRVTRLDFDHFLPLAQASPLRPHYPKPPRDPSDNNPSLAHC